MILHGLVWRSSKTVLRQKTEIYQKNKKIRKTIPLVGPFKESITLPYNPATNLTTVSLFFIITARFGSNTRFLR